MFMDLLQPFAISLMIGLAVGIDRERRAREGEGTMGVRTFAIIALLGTVSSKIDSAAVTAGLLLLLSVVVALGYARVTSLKFSGHGPGVEGESDVERNSTDIGLTTEFSAGLVFALGYLAIHERILAGILGIVLVSILYYHRYLHFFSRKFLQPADIGAALTLSISAFIIMPFLSITSIDSWGLLVPRRIMQITLLIGSTEFFGYLIQRVLGVRIGSLASGFLGGLVSSTAVFVSTARKTKHDEIGIPTAVGAALAATTATLLLFVAVVAITSKNLLATAGIPVSLAALAAGLCSHFFQCRNGHDVQAEAGAKSPLDVRRVLILSGMVVGLLTLTAVIKRFVGTEAFAGASFLSGLFELQAMAFAASMLHQSGDISLESATQALLLAASASFLSKVGISWFLGSSRFALWISISLLLSAGVGILAYIGLAYF
jgi:uncharacterized membrane protein (DUF4010 family)